MTYFKDCLKMYNINFSMKDLKNLKRPNLGFTYLLLIRGWSKTIFQDFGGTFLCVESQTNFYHVCGHVLVSSKKISLEKKVVQIFTANLSCHRKLEEFICSCADSSISFFRLVNSRAGLSKKKSQKLNLQINRT